jgi:hypothetical protein
LNLSLRLKKERLNPSLTNMSLSEDERKWEWICEIRDLRNKEGMWVNKDVGYFRSYNGLTRTAATASKCSSDGGLMKWLPLFCCKSPIFL